MSQFRLKVTGGLSTSSQFKMPVVGIPQIPSQPLTAPEQPPSGRQEDDSWLTEPRHTVAPTDGQQSISWLTDAQSNVAQTPSQPLPSLEQYPTQPTSNGAQSVSWLTDSHNNITTTGRQSKLSWWRDADSSESQAISQLSPARTDGHLMVPWGLPSVTGEQQAFAAPDQAISGEQSSVARKQDATAVHGSVGSVGNVGSVAESQMLITGEQGAVTWGGPALPHAPYASYDPYDTFSWSQTLTTGERDAVTWEQPEWEAAALPEAPVRVAESDLPRLERYTPLLALVLNIGLVVLIMLSENTGAFIGLRSSLWPGSLRPSLNDVTNNKNMSPLLFGTNMALFHDWDEPILKSANVRQMLKDIGVRVIRMPTRATLKDETEIAAANAIKAIGAVPLVVISGPEYKGNVLASNQHLLSLITSVFGKQPVYYEFGNESDLQGISAEQYVQVWNAVVPVLKQAYPQARFIGPDMYQFNRRYLKTFVQNARPRPDGVSWHEYTCSVHWSADFCLANIDTWPTHFAQARAAMREAIGTDLPIWISEYNYASDQMLDNDQPVDDGKFSNPAFMQAWTAKAMQALTEGHIYAALQYYATDPPMPLVTSDEKMGIEGKIFQQNYKKIMVDGYTPPQSTGILSEPALKPGTKIEVSFEGADTAGWTSTGAGISAPGVTTAKALDGKQSLRVTLSNSNENDTPFISTTVDKLLSVPKAGQMIHASVFVANKNALVNAKLFVGDSGGNWLYTNDVTLNSGAWTPLWYSLPTDFNGTVGTLGIQFNAARPGVSSDVYVDALYW
jgi:hypothetical protein